MTSRNKQLLRVIFYFSVLCGVFSFGFVLFWVWSIRIGFHPKEWRLAGAEYSFSQMMHACDFDSERVKISQCVQRALATSLPRWGIGALVEVATRFQVQADRSSIAVERCHDIQHQIGKTAVFDGVPMREILGACTELCQAGCFHGVALGLAAKGKFKGDSFLQFCFDKELPPIKRKECVHGMGHAVALLGLYDPHVSLSYCDMYAPSDRELCGNGVFMELYDGTEYNYSPLQDGPMEHASWCTQFDAPYDEVCASQYGYFVYSKTTSLENAIASCYAQSTPYQYDCIVFLGKKLYFIYPLTQEQHTDIQTYCQRAYKANPTQCIESVETNFPF